MTFAIEKSDGYMMEFNNYGITPLDLAVESLSTRVETDSIEGRDGFIVSDITYEGRTMRASFLFSSKNPEYYSHRRNDLFSLFNGKTYFYIYETTNPHKRWKVRTARKFTPARVNRRTGTFDIELISLSPYAKSPGTTLDMSVLDSYFSIGEGEITQDDPVVQYEFYENEFAVFNDSDVTVDPRDMDLKINLKGNLNNPIIHNVTTGDEWSWSGSAVKNDEIILNKIRSLKNGQSIFGQTNHKLITLAPGWNYFEIKNATDINISFDFPFYYF
mgnify:CR=1 FL=1